MAARTLHDVAPDPIVEAIRQELLAARLKTLRYSSRGWRWQAAVAECRRIERKLRDAERACGVEPMDLIVAIKTKRSSSPRRGASSSAATDSKIAPPPPVIVKHVPELAETARLLGAAGLVDVRKQESLAAVLERKPVDLAAALHAWRQDCQARGLSVRTSVCRRILAAAEGRE